MAETELAVEKVQVPTVLCVDDEPNILSSLRRLFRPDRYRVLTAESGAEGLVLLAKEEIDLVISDMRMPEMDGAQFLTQVAKNWPEVVRVLLTGYSDLSSTINAVNKAGIYQYVAKPWEDEPFRAIIKRALDYRYLRKEKTRLDLLAKKQNQELQQLNRSLEQKVAARTSELQQTADMLDQAYDDMKRSFADSVKVFGNLLELREQRIAGHSRRVTRYVEALTRELGLAGSQRQDCIFAAQLHHIGKIGFPDALLNGAFSSLSPQQQELVKKHPLIAESALLPLAPLHEAAKIIRHHHEHMNGTGYPDKLRGEEIPLGSRILAVASDFDELQLGTMHKGVYKMEDALAYLKEGRGSSYDPQVVDAFALLLQTIDSDESKIDEITLGLDDLEPGMVLTRDLMTKTGMLLLTRGRSLNRTVIEKIKEFEKDDGTKYRLFIKAN